MLWARPETIWPDAGTTGDLPWARRGSLPTVEVQVEGRTVTALVDSGAQYSVIDRDLFAELGLTRVFELPLVAYGVSGEPQMGRGVALDLSVGGLRMEGLRTAILDLGPLADVDGLATPLILGQDVLGAVVLDLDPAARTLRFTRPDVHVVAADQTAIPVEARHRALTAEVSVEGAVVRAVVDTGATSLLSLSAESAQAAGLLDGRAARAGSSIVLGGTVQARVVRARTLTFADRLYRNAAVAIYADSPLPGFPAALLGMEAFEGRRLTLDAGGGRLWATRPLDLTLN